MTVREHPREHLHSNRYRVRLTKTLARRGVSLQSTRLQRAVNAQQRAFQLSHHAVYSLLLRFQRGQPF